MLLRISLASDADHHEALEETGYWGRQAAGALFVARETGKILLLKRSDEVQEPRTWGGAGGACDADETPIQTARREGREELEYEGPLKLKKLAVFVDGAFKYHNFVGFVAKEFTPNLGWEASTFRWVDFGFWPRPLHPGLQWLLHHYDVELYAMIDKERKTQSALHGHVRPRGDRKKAKCGGSRQCYICKTEKLAKEKGLL